MTNVISKRYYNVHVLENERQHNNFHFWDFDNQNIFGDVNSYRIISHTQLLIFSPVSGSKRKSEDAEYDKWYFIINLFLCNIYWLHTLASFFLSTWKSFSLSSKELSLHHNIAIFRHQWSSFYFLMLSSSHYHYFSVMTRFSIRVTRNDLWLN